MPAFSTIVVPVHDLQAATDLYSAALGAQPHTNESYYVGFNVDGCEFGLTPADGPGSQDRVVAYVDHPDVAKVVADLVERGATVVQQPTDVGGGAKIAVLADADGNRLGVRSAT